MAESICDSLELRVGSLSAHDIVTLSRATKHPMAANAALAINALLLIVTGIDNRNCVTYWNS